MPLQNSQLKAHIANATATLLFGLNYSIAKGLMPVYLMPMQIVILRIIGAIVAFSVFQMFFHKEKIATEDYLRLAICGLLGVAINQVMFFKGLFLTTPVETAIIHTSSPIAVVVFAMWIIRERVTKLKAAGIITGIAGALLLALWGKEISSKSTSFIGNIFIFINTTAYALFLVLVKPLMKRYSPITVMKWVFIFGFIFVAPFTYNEIGQINWSAFQMSTWTALTYVVIGTTVATYLLTTYALKHLSASVVGYYIFMQPLIAALVAIFLGIEVFSIDKLMAMILIFAGVWMVNKKN